jgi:CRISPR-associated endonuclease/helicase Cas3
MIAASDFPEFFAAVNDGHGPFAWQVRLVHRLLEAGRWPSVIDAPTGAGKSSVIDIHVFANAAVQAAAEVGKRTARLPRRLIVTVNRRALVDGHAERAERLAQQLQSPDRDPLVGAVAALLCSMRVDGDPDAAVPLATARIRGGEKPDREWLDAPTACQVIAGTPDMIGSRLLFRGYGSSRYAWPREAGLLAFDSAIVIDEAHLNRQLVRTSRRIGEFVSSSAKAIGAPSVQTCAMTATQSDSQGEVIGVWAEDLTGHASDSILSDRLTRPKPLTLIPTPAWPGNPRSPEPLATVISDRVLAAASLHPGTVGCVVNTVEMAMAVSKLLQKSITPERVVSLVGRMRPFELHALRSRHPSLFTLKGDASVDVVVATQTVEVGIDMDFSALVTELAPGSAIAQRAGRVNRAGTRKEGPIFVIVPENGVDDKSRSGPYSATELDDSLRWLRLRESDPRGLSAWAIHPAAGNNGAPAARLQRPVLHRPEPWDALEWERTTDEAEAPQWLDLWLSDSLDPDHTLGLVVRQSLPPDLQSARRQILVTPPLVHEVFPVSLNDCRAILSRKNAPVSRAFAVRSADVTALNCDDLADFEPRSGDMIVIDSLEGICRGGVVTLHSPEAASPTDVSELSVSWAGPVQGRRWVRLSATAPCLLHNGKPLPGTAELVENLLAALARTEGTDDTTDDAKQLVEEWLSTLEAGLLQDDRRQLLAKLLTQPSLQVFSFSAFDPTGVADNSWVVFAGPDVLATGELQQTWHRGSAVELTSHQEAVKTMAHRFAVELDLQSTVLDTLTHAGAWHDEGKADHRFQRALRWRPTDQPGRILAKSGMKSQRAVRQARDQSGLPRRWRHEQLSAAIAYQKGANLDPAVRDLVVRLVGTSHGRGLHQFPHVGTQLVTEREWLDPAQILFDDDEWEVLLERTTKTWGVWGCAYLEAVLRAADTTVSRSQK